MTPSKPAFPTLKLTEQLTRQLPIFMLLLALAVAPLPASAEGELEDLDQVQLLEPGTSDWNFVLGAGGAYAADYSGADSYGKLFAFPIIDVSWRNQLTLSTLSGIRYNFTPDSAWSVGPLVRPLYGRPNEGALEDIEEIDSGFGAGAYVAYRFGSIRVRAEVLSAISGDVSGGEIVGGVNWSGRLGQRWYASVGPAVIWKSDSRMYDLYGVSAEDAAILGVSEYEPSAAVSSLRLTGNLTYAFNANWSASFIGIGTLLIGDAADSPVVEDLGDDFYSKLAVTVNYRF